MITLRQLSSSWNVILMTLMFFFLTILLYDQPFFVWLCTSNFISRFSNFFDSDRRSEIPILLFVKHIGWYKIAYNLIKLILFSDKISKVLTYVAYLQRWTCKLFFFWFLTWILTLSPGNYGIIMYVYAYKWLHNLSQYLWLLKFAFKISWKSFNLL